tara:strand:- start:1708 stop:3489 length:1782 start_codon:yes stop_codon:yes gene_type:complete
MTDYNINIKAKDLTGKAFGGVNSGLDSIKSKGLGLKTVFGIAGSAIAAFGAVKGIQNQIDAMDDLAKSARIAGAATSEEAFKGFQVLQKAMGEAGIDAATFERAILQTTTRLKAGTEGQKSYAAITDKLGQSLFDANGEFKTGDELLTTMINALNEGTITTEEFAKVVGGRAGPLIQQQFAALNTDAETLNATLSDVEANSNIVSLDAANNAEVFNDTIGRLKDSFGQLMTDALTPLMPVLVQLSQDLLANMPAIVEKVQGAFETLQPVFSLIGTVLTEVVFPVLEKVFGVLGSIADAITPLVEASIPMLKEGFETLEAIVQTIIEAFQTAVGAITDVVNTAVEMKDKVTGAFSDMKNKAVDSAKGLWEGVTGWFSKTEEDVVGGSIVPDMVNGVLSEFTRMEQGTTASMQTISDATIETSRTIENDFGSSLERAFSDGKLTLSDFSSFFANTMSKMIGDALRGRGGILGALGSVFGGGGGGGGMLGSLLGAGLNFLFPGAGGIVGSLFGGFFANGGRIKSGQFGITGEAGPELISGPATVTPFDQLSMGGGQPVTVNFNIETVDSTGFDELLMSRRATITGMVRSAVSSGRV